MIRPLGFIIFTAAIVLGSAAAVAAPASNPATPQHDPVATTSKVTPTDVSARRRHYRYIRHRWRVVRAYPRYSSYGYYGPRPYYYQPYPMVLPLPFGLGFGYNPYYYW